MLAPHHGLDFLTQPELGIVLAALALADDDGPFGLGLIGFDARVIDAVGLDCQRQIELARG